jgi:peptidoglycan hydrolase-like protein with peptidoglycan-binding domain
MFGGGGHASRGRYGKGPYVVGGAILAVLAVLAAGALIVSSSQASLTPDSSAIAKLGMPLGGGSVQSMAVVAGPSQAPVPIVIRGDRIWPLKRIAAGTKVTIYVVVKRPGWIAWLAGETQKLQLTMTTPVASLRSHYLTVGAHQPLLLHFKQPIWVYSYGPSGHLRRHVLATPQSVVPLPRNGAAGSIFVSAAPRAWESSTQALVSWFPATGAATAVANPAPETKIKPSTPIMLTFSKPVSSVLGSHLPPVSPATQGHWHVLNSHAIVFDPQGFGYGFGASVHVALPSGVRLVGGQQRSTSSGGTWTVPSGSTMRLQQMLAALGYLPLKFKYDGARVPLNRAAQEAAAIKPPAGRFSMRWSDIPGWYQSMWAPGAYGELTKAAVMAFENTEGMTADGVDGPQVWNALITALIKHQNNTFGYTVVTVNEGSPETESTWHNGGTRESGLVNTGIPAAPTAQGTFAVFEHALSVTMSGTNPDGSHYSDPGIPFVSYFNGGDALHYFARGGYGYPQSLGCVEMPYSEAQAVYPYTPIGTVVHVD